MEFSASILIANPISKDSWLRSPDYEWFCQGYGYAATQTSAIPTLAKCTPEELFHVVSAILREIDIDPKQIYNDAVEKHKESVPILGTCVKVVDNATKEELDLTLDD